MNRTAVILALLVPLLGGCDQLKERMGMPDPAKQEAEGKAIGAACRNAGQGLEDCYRLNPDTGKAAIYAGWKEMNEYMTKNNMPVIPPNSTMKADGSASASSASDSDAAPTPTPAPAPPADAGHEAKPKVDDKTKAKADDKHGGTTAH
jgi:hypothetical protein